MKKPATLTVFFGFLIVSLGASAASPQYPSAPLPPYAAEELQKVIDGASSSSTRIPPALQKSVVKPEAAADESHAAATVQKRPGPTVTSARRHARRKLV